MSAKISEFLSRRALIVLLILFSGGAVPINLLTVSFGYAQYVKGFASAPDALPIAHEFAASVYIPWLLVPALLALVWATWHCRSRYPDVYRRVVVGAGAGAIATVALDAVRLTGVVYGWLPGDTAILFGKLVTGSEVFGLWYPIGVLTHYMFGVGFGIFYTFVWGKRRSYSAAVGWALVWAMTVELGMMTLPPMAPFVGPFGLRFAWPQMFLLTLTAHVIWGVALGLVAQLWLQSENRNGLLTLLRGPSKIVADQI